MSLCYFILKNSCTERKTDV